ncbi:MAG: ATP-dependent Clp protease proteolytic subunit [Clostridia bacterium]|nr:ATP-dependent Clp protease proteolytic subunit [Clostridia bacterium]
MQQQDRQTKTSSLLDNGIVLVYGEITNASAQETIAELQYLNTKYPNRPIELWINSPGGSVADALAIIDVINYVKPIVIGLGMGMVASAAALILSACSRGHRMLLPNAEVLIHQPLGGAQGQASEVIAAAKHMQKVKDRVTALLATNCRQPIEKVYADTDRDYIMDAEESLAYGIVDSIVSTMAKAK